MAAFPRGGAISQDSPIPTPIVTSGVTRISTFVSFETSFPISAEMMAIISTAKGPPASPSALAANHRKKNKGRTFKCRSDCYRHSGSAHSHSKAAYSVFLPAYRGHSLHQKRYLKLCTDGVYDRSDKQRAKQSLRHSTKGIDPVSFKRNLNVFFL